MSVLSRRDVSSEESKQKFVLENFQLEGLTPKARYEKLREMLQSQGFTRSVVKIETETRGVPFQAEKYEPSPYAVGFGGGLAGYGVVRVLGDLFSKWTPEPETIFRSFPREKAASSSTPTKIAIGGALIVGAGAFAVTSYILFELNLNEDIRRVFMDIQDNDVNAATLLDRARAIYEKKENSTFASKFTDRNPISTAYLLLTYGIALDSTNDHARAQQMYEEALRLSLEEPLQSMIHYAFARSYRKSNHRQQAELQLDQIPNGLSISRLRDVERSIFQDGVDAVLNDEEIPYDFINIFNEEVIVHPVYYMIGNHRSNWEKAEIENWVQKNANCPATRAPLTLDDLYEDELLAEAIHVWKQLNLKDQ